MKYYEETCKECVIALFNNIDQLKENILKAKDNPELVKELKNTLDLLNYNLEKIYIEEE